MKNESIELINNITSKRQGIFTGNFIISFLNAGKTGNMPEFKSKKF